MYSSSLLPALALGSSLSALVSAGIPPVCLFNLKESCHTSAPASCCLNAQMLQTQFWDANPAAGPADHWTIHGLWPDHCDGTFDAYCDPTREYTNISSILTSFGRHDLLRYMETYWPDYHGGDESFWDHEFGKHATCINTLDPSCYYFYTPQQEVVDFFSRTVELFRGLNTYRFLAAAGIFSRDFQGDCGMLIGRFIVSSGRVLELQVHGH